MPDILTRQDGPVLHITINQPDKGNAVTDDMVRELTRAINEAPKTSDVVVLRGAGKVVDIGIQRTLDALVGHPEADLLLCSHDADFVEHVQRLVDGERRLGLLAFREFTASSYTAAGVEIHDLEDDVHAFNVSLPRVRIIPLDLFDPEAFLR